MSSTLDRIEQLAYELQVSKQALLQAQEAAKKMTFQYEMHCNAMGRLAVAAFGAHNNVSDDEVVRKIERIVRAARALAEEGQEYAFDDLGLGRGAPNSFWEDLDDAIDEEAA